MLTIRPYRPGDAAALHGIFFAAIRASACGFYTVEQTRAWASDEFDLGLWTARIESIQPFVAFLGEEAVAYADVQRDGYIDHFFVSPTHSRQGIGSALMVRLHESASGYGTKTLHSHVSLAAQAFFLRHGFHIVERQRVTIRGVALDNARMSKALAAGRSQSPIG